MSRSISKPPRVSRCNIVTPEHCWMLHVLSVCTPCCMFLRVVGSCCAKFETSQFLATITPNGQKNFQRYWPLPYSFRKAKKSSVGYFTSLDKHQKNESPLRLELSFFVFIREDYKV